jgi:hypothetical protein
VSRGERRADDAGLGTAEGSVVAGSAAVGSATLGGTVTISGRPRQLSADGT